MTQFTSNHLRSNRLWTWSLFLKDINTMVWGSMRNDLEPQGLGANPPFRWCLKLVNWYMCVCQKSMRSGGVVLSQVFPVTYFTSFYIILPHFLEMNALNPTGGGQHPYPRFVTRPGFQSRRSWHQRMPEEKPLSDNGFRDMGIFDVDEFLDAT